MYCVCVCTTVVTLSVCKTVMHIQRFAGRLSEASRQGAACGFTMYIHYDHKLARVGKTADVSKPCVITSATVFCCSDCLRL